MAGEGQIAIWLCRHCGCVDTKPFKISKVTPMRHNLKIFCDFVFVDLEHL
jgi:hypothetical protein